MQTFLIIFKFCIHSIVFNRQAHQKTHVTAALPLKCSLPKTSYDIFSETINLFVAFHVKHASSCLFTTASNTSGYVSRVWIRKASCYVVVWKKETGPHFAVPYFSISVSNLLRFVMFLSVHWTAEKKQHCKHKLFFLKEREKLDCNNSK